MVLTKLGIEPATPGLQDIVIIHYTTAASNKFLFGSRWSSEILINYLFINYMWCIELPVGLNSIFFKFWKDVSQY